MINDIHWLAINKVYDFIRRFGLLSILALLLSMPAYGWFDTNWTYRATFNANNPGGTLIDQQVQIDLNSSNVHPDYVWSADGDDIRAVASDDVTILDYYIENWDAFNETATIYVKFASLPPGDSTVQIYYGNPAAPDASDPVAVLTEIGLRYHTRQSFLDPTNRAQALAEFNGLNDNVTGYGCTTVSEFVLINNRSEFPGNVNSNILFFSNNHFEVPASETGLWRFQFGGDYGRGGGMYLDNIDSDERWGEDLWWGGSNFNDPDVLLVEGTLDAGFHNLQLIGAEGCCDGGTSVRYQSPANPGVWRVWNTSNVNIRSERCEVTTISTTLISSSLVNSSKSVIDLNGGDVEIGDVLRYTITLNESSGTDAEFVTVTDDLASQFSDLTIISTPTASTDGSDPSGGVNSTGQVLVSNITVPANGSVTIIFDVTIAVVPVGTTLDNSATIENLSGGADITVNAPTLTVSINQLPTSGVKNLYLYNDNSLTRVVPTSDQSFVLIDEQFDSEVWTLSPALAAPLTVDKTVDQSISLYMRRAGEVGWAFRALRIRVSGSSSGLIAEYSDDNISIPAGTGFSLFALTLTYADANPLTLAQGETITLEIINESEDFVTGTSGPVFNDDIEVYHSNTSGATPNTILNFPSSTVINVDSVTTVDNAGTSQTSFYPGTSVFVRATVSDPFGVDDISAATIDITDAGSNLVVNDAVMTELSAAGAIKVYEYQYNIVGIPAQGSWSATVTAEEGTEGTINDTGTGTFAVVLPPVLTTVISASVASVLPGDPVTYNIVTTNSGTGDAVSVLIQNSLAPFSSLRLDTYGASNPISCTVGCPASGLTFGTPEFSDDNGVTFTYTPVSQGGGAPLNYDANVTDCRVLMGGTMPGNGNEFTLEYEVIVE